MAYTAIGLKPDGATTWLLPQLIGMRRAQEMAISNRRVGAEEGVSLGLITRVADDALLADEVRQSAGVLARAATHAVGAARTDVKAFRLSSTSGSPCSAEASLARFDEAAPTHWRFP